MERPSPSVLVVVALVLGIGSTLAQAVPAADPTVSRVQEAGPSFIAQAGALLELHADLVVGVRRLTRRWLNAGGDPSRQLVDAWRELRMLSDRVLSLLETQGALLQGRAFFGELDGRMARVLAGVTDVIEPLIRAEPT